MQSHLRNFCTTAGLLTAAGAETVYDTTAAIISAINGKFNTTAAITDGAMPTTDGNTGAVFTTLAASQGCVLVFAVNAADAVSVYQGNVEDLAEDGSFRVAADFASVPDTVVPFAYMILKNGSTGSTFTIGASNWNATGMTVTIADILVMPDRPQES